MKHQILENELKSRIKRRRIFEIAAGILFLALATFCTIQYRQSKVVETIDLLFGEYESVSYNTDWLWGIAIGWSIFVSIVMLILRDFNVTDLSTIEVNGYYVTLYRGLMNRNLYVDGDYKDGIFADGYYLETVLPDGTRINVALKGVAAHMSFSNGMPSIDL